MNPNLAHLPQEKQEELARVSKEIQKATKVEMIWLFGSYATGKWVEDVTYENGTRLEYRSDYDILVILPYDDVKAHYKVHNAIKNKLIKKGLLHTQVSIIYHGIKDINEALTIGSYFFVDLFKEGIELYNNSKHTLAQPKKLSAAERQAKAQEHYDQWFVSGVEFFEGYEFYFSKENYHKAAFLLHQTCEHLLHCTLLVFQDYKPKQHDLELLEQQVVKLDQRFASVFPKQTEEELRLFSLLKRAYIDSRYRMDNYHITKSELAYLSTCVRTLQELTAMICQERIASIGEG